MREGDYYTLEVTQRPGLEASNGMVRMGPVPTTSVEEIKRFEEVLEKINYALVRHHG